ncbi:MAG: F0F1 ATP synthase subunit A [bacterium JZ-2024 1]
MEQAEVPSIAHFLYPFVRAYLPEWVDFHTFEVLFFALLSGIFLSVLGWLAMRKAEFFPKGLQNAVEFLYEGLLDWYNNFMEDRKEAERYFPFYGSFFFYILVMNLIGIFPFFRSPTSYYMTTLSLAVVSIVGTWVIAISRLGPIQFVKHLIGEPLWLFPLTLPIHLVGEISRILSLSIRLAANIYAEDTALVVMILLGVLFLPLWLPLPIAMPFMFLMVIFSTAQALIFSTLTAVYIRLWLPVGEHH